MNKRSIQTLSVFSLAMLITGSIDSIRNLPATALFGESLLFFFVLAAIFFLIPTALVSAELAASSEEEGGVYHWVKVGLGKPFAVLAIWLQWINTMVWYPTILSFIAGTAAFLIDPALAQNKVYLVSIILVVFWGLTFLNLKGLQTSASFAAICTVIGMIVPMAIIIGIAFIWFSTGMPSQLHFSVDKVIPQLGSFNSWVSLTAIIASFLGMELATVHIRDIKNPQKKFPMAMLISVLIILFTMMFGSLSIALVLPKGQIGLVDGVMHAFSNYFKVYHITWVVPILAMMLFIGSLGGMVNWIISPAKGLLQAAEDGYLPALLIKRNEHGVATTMLILQACLVSLVCLVFLFMPSVNGSYWLLTDLSTQLYVLMYVLMFITAFCLRWKSPKVQQVFKIPGGLFGLGFVCLLGLSGCTITMIVGFFPPEGVNVGSQLLYEVVFSTGLFMMIIPVLGLYLYRFFTRQKVLTNVV